jgi:hypothetical protein
MPVRTKIDATVPQNIDFVPILVIFTTKTQHSAIFRSQFSAVTFSALRQSYLGRIQVESSMAGFDSHICFAIGIPCQMHQQISFALVW